MPTPAEPVPIPTTAPPPATTTTAPATVTTAVAAARAVAATRAAGSSGRVASPYGTPPPPPRRPPAFALVADLARPRPVVPAAVGLLLVGVWATAPAPPGLHWGLLAGLAAAAVRAVPGRALSVGDRVLLGLGLGLVVAGAVRTNALVWLGVPAGLLCLAVVLLGARRWPAVLLAPPMLAGRSLPGVAWLVGGIRCPARSATMLSWARGALVGLALTGAVAALLASADAAFATLLDAVLPQDVDLAPGRFVATAVVGAVVASLVGARLLGQGWAWLPPRRAARPAVEWALPLLLLDVVLVTFVGVRLVLAVDDAAGGQSPAEAAREGFGQLVAATVLIATALGRAGRGADPRNPRHCVALPLLGAVAVAGALTLGAIALTRMWRYEQAFGGTVLRLLVAVFEVWLGAVLLYGAWSWLVGRTASLPRAVLTSGAAVLLALVLVSPDALVARWNVDRFERTGRMDVEYLGLLSDDALPELASLPDPLRCKVFGLTGEGPRATGADWGEPWYAVNPSRERARNVRSRLDCRTPGLDGSVARPARRS